MSEEMPSNVRRSIDGWEIVDDDGMVMMTLYERNGVTEKVAAAVAKTFKRKVSSSNTVPKIEEMLTRAKALNEDISKLHQAIGEHYNEMSTEDPGEDETGEMVNYLDSAADSSSDMVDHLDEALKHAKEAEEASG